MLPIKLNMNMILSFIFGGSRLRCAMMIVFILAFAVPIAMYAVFRFMGREDEHQAHLQAEHYKRQEKKEIQEAKMRAEKDRNTMAKAEENSTGIPCPIETYGDWRSRPFWLSVPDVEPSRYMDVRFLTEEQMWAVKERDRVVTIKRLMEMKYAMQRSL
ncbi:hypothetical protein BHYA_0271g00020 [Botrytis hyacinthi]|uniref:Uncharacterized protein n=1 Tax=Botrytis hyacinthi TaxID=278943 RepID=A0A4Z1GCD7_9HELO|nr:hypothetical protein BHYA_0271g00020 [Botrytis hyacinthi]